MNVWGEQRESGRSPLVLGLAMLTPLVIKSSFMIRMSLLRQAMCKPVSPFTCTKKNENECGMWIMECVFVC